MPGEVIGVMDFGKVGYLSDRDRRDLTHCFVLAMSQDTDGYVEQLIRMGASSEQVDSKALSQDISRILIQYQNLPLKDIHVDPERHALKDTGVKEMTRVVFRSAALAEEQRVQV